MTNKYDDIIDLPHHVSATHPQMSMHARAAQFAPFAALSGHHAAALRAGRAVFLLCGGPDAFVPVRPVLPAFSRKNRLFGQNSRKES